MRSQGSVRINLTRWLSQPYQPARFGSSRGVPLIIIETVVNLFSSTWDRIHGGLHSHSTQAVVGVGDIYPWHTQQNVWLYPYSTHPMDVYLT